jgi:hypothetical protein
VALARHRRTAERSRRLAVAGLGLFVPAVALAHGEVVITLSLLHGAHRRDVTAS